MAYAAYLRIYEPVSAFHEPDRSRWGVYADSSTWPRRRDSLAVEHAEALRRAITTPWVAVPERESEHAYVRRVDGITYVCPWQTRLRCLLAYGQTRSESGAVLAGEGLAGEGLALVYTTPMTRARRRVARGLAALRHLPAGSGDAVLEPVRAVDDLAEVGRWLEDFHPYSLVELDYGGLVHLVSDDALCGDQSVAELRAAIDGAARGECELAVAMYLRARDRWRAFAELEQAN
jgi:hypothetical protein